MYQNQEQKNPNIQPYTSKMGTKTKESDSPWKNTKQMLDFDTINLDGSTFENDPNSETENRKEEQTQVKPIKRNLHNGPPTSSFDREIQIHHKQQDNSGSQKAAENYTTNKNKLINQNQMMEALTGAISNILKEDKKSKGLRKGSDCKCLFHN